jgi:hypothetical protein
MPVESADLKWLLSASGASEGGARSAVEVADATSENLFPNITEAEALAGGTDYRKLFSANDDGVDSYPEHSIWLKGAPSAGHTMSIGLGFDDGADADATAGILASFSAAAKVALVSDGADTRSCDVWGYDAAGDPLMETVVLTGAAEVLSVATFSDVLAVHTTTSGSRTVTIKQGTGGTTRGQIAIGQAVCFRWLAATTKSTGIKLPPLATGGADGVWIRRAWAASLAAIDATEAKLRTEEL